MSIDLDFFTRDVSYDMAALLRPLGSIGRLDVIQHALMKLIAITQRENAVISSIRISSAETLGSV